MSDGATLRRHWWVAALLGLLVAGLGQLYVGQFGLALAFAAAWLVGTLLLATDLLQTFGGLVLTLGSVLALHFASLGLAAVRAWRHPSIARQWMHRWYSYPLFLVAVVLVSLGIDIAAYSAFGVVPWMERYKPARNVSASMEPTLRSGDYFMTERVSIDFPAPVARQVGDIVLYRPASLNGTFVHRLVASGGDQVAMREGNLVINGQTLPRTALCDDPKALPEDGPRPQLSAEEHRGRQYAVQHMASSEGSAMREFEPQALPDGYFFVIGDARDNSNDSRFQGPLRDEEFEGRALYIIWSSDWSRIGRSVVPARQIVRSDYCGEARVP